MEIKEKNVIAAYRSADDNGKNMLKVMFPDFNFENDNRPVTERIKTFDDVLREIEDMVDNKGDNTAKRLLADYNGMESYTPDLEAYIKLRLVVYAINEGWEPQFTQDEVRWYPWHFLWTAEELEDKDDDWRRKRALIPVDSYQQEGWAGFSYALSNCAPSYTFTSFGSRLCCKDEITARHAATAFIDLWADFKLIRK